MAARAVWIVTKERPSDRVGILGVQCLALGEAEAQLVDQLREEEGSNYGPSVVAEEAGRIIGHTLLTRTRFVSDAGEAKEIYVLGPMGVVPERQRCGLGKEMIRLALDLIKLPVAVL